MKTIPYIFALLLISMGACKNSSPSTATDKKVEAQSDATASKYTVAASSLLNWHAAKVVGEHTGTIAIKEGTIEIKDKQIVAGNFTIDLKSIVDLDLKDAEYNSKLVNHLKSAEFFNIDSFPTANFVISSVTPTSGDSVKIAGNLTIKGITKGIEFPARVVVTDDKITAQGIVVLNRTDFNMVYHQGNSWKDMMIKDNFDIQVDITATK